jgi:hypothetical protein
MNIKHSAGRASVTAPALRVSGGSTRAYRRRWFSLTTAASACWPACAGQPQPRRRALKPPAPQLAGRLAPPRLRGFKLHSRGRADKTTWSRGKLSRFKYNFSNSHLFLFK